jgi:hypothetical protein
MPLSDMARYLSEAAQQSLRRVAAVVTRSSFWLAGTVLYPALQSPVCVFLYLDVLGLCVRVHASKPDGMEVMASVELWGCTTKGAGVTMIESSSG